MDDEYQRFVDFNTPQRSRGTDKRKVIGAALGAAALFLGGLYSYDRHTVKYWSSFTNSIPQMIAHGNIERAIQMQHDVLGDIRSTVKTKQTHDPLKFIYQSDVDRLERDLSWDALKERARNIPSLDDRDHTMYNPKHPY